MPNGEVERDIYGQGWVTGHLVRGGATVEILRNEWGGPTGQVRLSLPKTDIKMLVTIQLNPDQGDHPGGEVYTLQPEDYGHRD